MCGVMGYIGSRNVCEVLLKGLESQEYRGYDSAGIAVTDGKEIHIVKGTGRVAELSKKVDRLGIDGVAGIGHTRWATHGGVTDENAHPHVGGPGEVVLIHNGIIENFRVLQAELEGCGVAFNTSTDTEAAVQMLAFHYKGDPLAAIVKMLERIEGAFALSILFRDTPDKIYCVRQGSPLVLGVGKGETMCASDAAALLPYTRDVVYMNDGDVAELSREGLRLWDFKGNPLVPKTTHIDWNVSMTEKGEYPHFMLKEIHEQPTVVRKTLEGRTDSDRVDLSKELSWTEARAKAWKKLHLIACGTSYYAALAAERFIEKVADLEMRVEVASEYRYRNVPVDADTLAFFVSQSGETADTLAAQRLAKQKGAHCVAITNVRGSTIAREADEVLELRAGPEICVAATKTFTAQFASLVLMGLYLGKLRGSVSPEEERHLIEEFRLVPAKAESLLTIESEKKIADIAETFVESHGFLFIGRGISYPIALEGALKLKEISYMHAEAYAAGEMKHGPIAMLDPNTPVVALAASDPLYDKMLSNILEAKARLSPIVALATEGNPDIDKSSDRIIWLPPVDERLQPLLQVIPLQLFAYDLAYLRGCDIDKPRNLAKSVTVE